jgi:hypothetical protein
VLVPTPRPSNIVVMDNLGSHRGKALRRAIRSVGAKLFFLPKYSPDLPRWIESTACLSSMFVCWIVDLIAP